MIIKHKTLLGITTVLFGAAVIYYFNSNQFDDHKIQLSQPSNSNQLEQQADIPALKFDQTVTEQGVLRELSPRNLARNFESAVSAEAAQSVILEAYNAGEVELAELLETELHSRCQEHNSTTGYRIEFKRTKWAFDNIEKYCSSYTPVMDMEEYLNRLAQKFARKTHESSKLFEKYLDSDPEEADIDFADHIARASDATEIDAALAALEMLHTLGMSPSLGQDKTSFSTPDQELRLKQIALEMYECYLFGGCGSEGMTTQVTCGLTGQCDPGRSMYDFYLYTLSPAEYEQAELMFKYLYGLQSGG